MLPKIPAIIKRALGLQSNATQSFEQTSLDTTQKTAQPDTPRTPDPIELSFEQIKILSAVERKEVAESSYQFITNPNQATSKEIIKLTYNAIENNLEKYGLYCYVFNMLFYSVQNPQEKLSQDIQYNLKDFLKSYLINKGQSSNLKDVEAPILTNEEAGREALEITSKLQELAEKIATTSENLADGVFNDSLSSTLTDIKPATEVHPNGESPESTATISDLEKEVSDIFTDQEDKSQGDDLNKDVEDIIELPPILLKGPKSALSFSQTVKASKVPQI